MKKRDGYSADKLSCTRSSSTAKGWICRNKRTTRLVVYDEDRAVPSIKAQLGASEREALRKALGTDK